MRVFLPGRPASWSGENWQFYLTWLLSFIGALNYVVEQIFVNVILDPTKYGVGFVVDSLWLLANSIDSSTHIR